jgi:hypothetical protein
MMPIDSFLTIVVSFFSFGKMQQYVVTCERGLTSDSHTTTDIGVLALDDLDIKLLTFPLQCQYKSSSFLYPPSVNKGRNKLG